MCVYKFSLENNISNLFICFQSPIRSWSWKRRPAPRCRSTFSAWRDPSRIWRSTRRSTSTTSPIRQVSEWNFVFEYLLTIQIANRKTKANTTYCHYQTAPNAIACWLRKQSTVGASINIFAYILDLHPIYTIFIHIDWSCFCCPSKHTRGRAPAKRTILNADFVRFTQQRALCLDAHIYHKTNHQKNILPLTIFHARATLFWLLITILVTLFSGQIFASGRKHLFFFILETRHENV